MYVCEVHKGIQSCCAVTHPQTHAHTHMNTHTKDQLPLQGTVRKTTDNYSEEQNVFPGRYSSRLQQDFKGKQLSRYFRLTSSTNETLLSLVPVQEYTLK